MESRFLRKVGNDLRNSRRRIPQDSNLHRQCRENLDDVDRPTWMRRNDAILIPRNIGVVNKWRTFTDSWSHPYYRAHVLPKCDLTPVWKRSFNGKQLCMHWEMGRSIQWPIKYICCQFSMIQMFTQVCSPSESPPPCYYWRAACVFLSFNSNSDTDYSH
jgi:hypothetical protein